MKLLFVLLTVAFVAPAHQRLPGADASAWDALLKEFVNAQHLVDYARLKRDASNELDGYIAALGQADLQSLATDQRKATLINAYNAFTIRWIVQSYPVSSIWSTRAPFTEPRHKLGGRVLSLDQIESELRAMGDPRIHAALVCAARSCPPLRREAYVAGRIDEQLDANVREWLANPALNQFDAAKATATVSPIFKWYANDFTAYPGGLEAFLRKYAPPNAASTLNNPQLKIEFQDYNWGLNDQHGAGADYSQFRFALDRFRNWLLSFEHR